MVYRRQYSSQPLSLSKDYPNEAYSRGMVNMILRKPVMVAEKASSGLF